MEDKRRDFNRSFMNPGSETKSFSGVKRLWKEVEEAPGLLKKCAKMQDLQPVISCEGRGTSYTLDIDNSQASSMPIDLNIDSCTPSNMIVNGINVDLHQVNPLPSSTKSGGFRFDLNVGDFSSSNNDSFHSYNKDLKFNDKNECMSSVGPLDKKDPMKVWKEMKQNGFLSSSHGGVPMPRRRGRKKEDEGIKNNMELAKKEQMDRFAKIAGPSSLLNELNPGIINHVRNSKQVRSIMEALAKSEKHEKQHEVSTTEDQLKQSSGTKGLKKALGGSGLNICTVSREVVGSLSEFAKTEQMAVYPASEKNNSSPCNEDSANLTGFTSLSVNAANVASLWLELLHQDIKGRLAALQHSKTRVQAVIQIELPFLLSKEFPPLNENQSRDSDKKSTHCLAADAHRTRWTSLFDQMDRTLSQEESQLESWLNQIREMQVLCENGLMKYHDLYGMQQHGLFENERLNKFGFLEEDSAVLAAAASIYSTCNFLSSMENLPCC